MTPATVVAAVAVLSVAVVAESDSPVVVDDVELVAIVETVDNVVEPDDLAVV